VIDKYALYEKVFDIMGASIILLIRNVNSIISIKLFQILAIGIPILNVFRYEEAFLIM